MPVITETEAVDARAVAYVDLRAIEHNCRVLKERLDGSKLCAVVKANGYGHGAVQAARAAVAGGADWLAVASAGEAAELRRNGIEGRLLVMGAFTPVSARVALEADADLVVWRDDQLDVVLEASTEFSPRLHVKLDTGMGRLGTREVEVAHTLVRRVADDSRLTLAGFMTHFATADEAESSLFDEQLERFTQAAAVVKRHHPDCIVHAANSAAVLRTEAAHFDLARCGIAIYGLDPSQGDPTQQGLRPALALESYVADVKQLDAGDSVGYGSTWIAEDTTAIAVLPIGYADGYRRGLSNRGEVLIGGRRYPIVGTVSMDNVTVEMGRNSGVVVGDRAVLIGEAGKERVLAEDLADRLGTINYEITCGISARVPRVYDRDPN